MMKKRLMMMFVLIGGIPLLFLALYSYNLLYEKTMQEYNLEMQKKMSITESGMRGLIEENMTVLKVLASNSAFGSFSAELAKPILANTQKVYPNMSISLDNSAGMQIATGDTRPTISVAERDFFKEAIQGKQAISKILVGKATNQLIVVLAVPLKINGKVEGVVQGSIVLDVLSEYTRKVSENGSLVYIVDTEGKILAHPDDKKVKERVDVTGLDFIQRGLKGESGLSTIKDEQGKEIIVHYVHDENTGWLICSEIPKSIVMAGLNNFRNYFLGIFLLIALGLAGIGWLLANKITKPLVSLRNTAQEVATGNLIGSLLNFTERDEIGEVGQAFDAMSNNLRKLVREAAASADQVAASAEELSASAEQSSKTVKAVAASITEVSQGTNSQAQLAEGTLIKVLEGMKAMERTAQTAQGVSISTDSAVNQAKSGGQTILQAIDKMAAIEENVLASAKAVEKLGEGSKQIGNIITTISTIAGQTNLLALNAAIEAARAGESGRGFAVVADEVRKLAEQSQAAVKQIAEVIGHIQEDTELAVHAMQNSTIDVSVGREIINNAGSAFTNINTTIQSVSKEVRAMSVIMEKTVKEYEEMVAVFQKITLISKDAAKHTHNVSASSIEQLAAMEEMAVFSKGLATMASELKGSVSVFRI